MPAAERPSGWRMTRMYRRLSAMGRHQAGQKPASKRALGRSNGNQPRRMEIFTWA